MTYLTPYLIDGFFNLTTKRCNRFFFKGPSKEKCSKFFIEKHHVGFIQPHVKSQLSAYEDVFTIKYSKSLQEDIIVIHKTLDTTISRSNALKDVLLDLKKRKLFSNVLNGWRDEEYGVYTNERSELLVQLERCACSLFGVVQLGVHINGLVREGNDLKMWIATRSSNKQTYPDCKDNAVAGGVSVNTSSLMDSVIRECEEEASIPLPLAKSALSVSNISYIIEDERGILPEIEYCYDLFLPPDFQPVNSDGEVSKFECLPISEVIPLIVEDDFKPNSAMVILDFLYRYGYITPDNLPKYKTLYDWMHVKLPLKF